MSKELNELVEACRGKAMSKDEVEAQRVSFVYGNAPKDDRGTRETVLKSLEIAG